jgi:hypothetical protein
MHQEPEHPLQGLHQIPVCCKLVLSDQPIYQEVVMHSTVYTSIAQAADAAFLDVVAVVADSPSAKGHPRKWAWVIFHNPDDHTWYFGRTVTHNVGRTFDLTAEQWRTTIVTCDPVDSHASALRELGRHVTGYLRDTAPVAS